jgi:uncharacterized protein with ATP-grasp and redox domains
MRTYLDCLPCMMYQALRAGRTVTSDEGKIRKILDKTGDMIKHIPMENPPPMAGEAIYRFAKEISGLNDPYKEMKRSNIQEVLSLYPELKEIVKRSADPLLTAIRIAIAGNVIDLGINDKFNIERDVREILKQDFAILDYRAFRYQLTKADSILYLGDNAGESVFDKILIEELGKPVIYVVRENPIINDVTYQDALDSGLDEISEIISSGSSAPGTILSLCNEEFLLRFRNSNFIISKGQGNYEGLSNVKRPVFFLLKIKCHIIARDLKVKEGDIVLKGIKIHR